MNYIHLKIYVINELTYIVVFVENYVKNRGQHQKHLLEQKKEKYKNTFMLKISYNQLRDVMYKYFFSSNLFRLLFQT